MFVFFLKSFLYVCNIVVHKALNSYRETKPLKYSKIIYSWKKKQAEKTAEDNQNSETFETR